MGGSRRKRPVIRSDGKRYESIAQAADDSDYRATPEAIWQCCRGKREVAGGYGWRYDDEVR